MAVPYFFRDQVDEARALEHGPLAARFAAERTVDVSHAQVGSIVGRRQDAVFDVLIGIEPIGGKVVAELHRLMALLERNGERKSLPVLGVAIVLVLVGQHERIAVLIENGENLDRLRLTTQAGGPGQGHGPDLVRAIELAARHLVPDEGNARDFLQRYLQPLLGVLTEAFAIYERRGTRDRQEPHAGPSLLPRVLFLGRG